MEHVWTKTIKVGVVVGEDTKEVKKAESIKINNEN